MFYISKTTPLFVIVSFIYLLTSFFYEDNIMIWSYLTIYGFLQSLIIGVLYQIGPNSQTKKLKYENFTYVVLVFTVIYFIPIILNLFELANILIFLTVLSFSIHIMSVFKNIRPLTVRFLSVGIIYLNLSTSILLLTNFLNVPYQLAIHVFTIGVLLNAVIGVQLTWIPMLTMKVIDLDLSKKLFYSMLGCVFIFLLSFYTFNFYFIITAGTLIFLNVLFFLYIVYKPVFTDKAMGIPIVVVYFLAGWVSFILGFFGIAYTILTMDFDYLILHRVFMIYGFGIFTVLGGTAHIVPRIVWNYRYMEKVKKGEDVPQINRMMEEKVLKYGFTIIVIALILNLTSGFVGHVLSFILITLTIVRIFLKVIKFYLL